MTANKRHLDSSRHLTGQGGLGLVVFHLARLKIEFAMTPDRSPLGDIWVSVASEKYGIEVKTCRGAMKWQINKTQIAKVDFYVLVAMDTAQCFVLGASEIDVIVEHSPRLYGDVHMISKIHIPDGTLNAWGRIDGKTYGFNMTPSLLHPRQASPVIYTHKKTVKKTLADGTIRTYTYHPATSVRLAEMTTVGNRKLSSGKIL